MKTTTLAIAAAMAAGTLAHAQDAVQWRVEDGGNGHWYALLPCGGSWLLAQQGAGIIGGHLTTVTSMEEDLFVRSTFPPTEGYWVGGFQDASAPDFNEPSGGWRWITGEEFSFAVWGPGQPDNLFDPQNYLRWRHGSWDDIGLDECGFYVQAALVEWSADCNGDGIVDYGQILDGTFEDANENGVPDACECFADVNQDGIVNGADISAVLGFWGLAGKPLPAADITRDGIVDGADLAVLLGSWGECP